MLALYQYRKQGEIVNKSLLCVFDPSRIIDVMLNLNNQCHQEMQWLAVDGGPTGIRGERFKILRANDGKSTYQIQYYDIQDSTPEILSR